MGKYKLLLFDLDGTLLNNDKTISKRTLSALKRCSELGLIIGISTARSEHNLMSFLSDLHPDIIISSGGALIKSGDRYISKAVFSPAETRFMIDLAKEICGKDCEITIDTLDGHYWNYKIDPKKQDSSWGDSIYTDFKNFNKESLKMCVEIFDENKAGILKEALPQCDCIRFSDGYWYKLTQKGVTKEEAIGKVCSLYNINIENIIAFGDDFSDIGMIELCGLGIAMGNAIDEVKEKADIIIESNDNDGIAKFLEKEFL